MDRLNYNQLYYFYIVATEGSVKAACEKLHLTQPTISGQIRTLESDLGFDLFVRKHRRLELSPYGHDVLKKAEKIFTMGDELISALPGKNKKMRNEIRLGVVQTLTNNFLHDFTVKAWKDPNVRIKVLHSTHKELFEKMNEDAIDLILSDTPPSSSSKRYKSIHIDQQNLMVVGTDKFKSLRKNFPFSIDGAPFLSFGLGGQVHSEINYFFKINNIKPDFIGSVDDLTLIQMAAQKGYCISILPESLAKRTFKDKSLIKIGDFPEVILNNWLITSQAGSKKIIIRKLINDYMLKKRRQ